MIGLIRQQIRQNGHLGIRLTRYTDYSHYDIYLKVTFYLLRFFIITLTICVVE